MADEVLMSSVVLSGSGVKYFCHIGALKALEEAGIKIDRICGTSGGAIVAALYASGYGFNYRAGYRGNMEHLALEMLPGDYIQFRWNPLSKPYGLINTSKFLEAFNALMIHQFKNCFVDLSIVTVDLEKGIHEVWNKDNPIHIPDAVVASMSIPIVFEYKTLNGKVHVDGGVAANFPIDIYGTGEDVYGVKIRSTSTTNNVSSRTGFVSSVIDTMMGAVEREYMADAMYARVIDIPVDYPTTGFNVTKRDAKKMIDHGYNFTKERLKNGNA